MFDKPTPTMLYPLEKPGIPLSLTNFNDMTKKLRNCSIFLKKNQSDFSQRNRFFLLMTHKNKNENPHGFSFL